jgi:outer membrane protein TolC
MRSFLSRCAVFLLASLAAGTNATAEEPPTGAGLGLLDAVRMTLERDPNIALDEARLQSSRGSLEVAVGEFDPVLGSTVTQADTRTPLSPTSSSDSRTLHSTLGVAKQFRTGLSIEPQLDLLRSEDVSAGSGAVNQGTLSFVIRQPLLRGRGRAAADVDELAAQREVAASGLDLRQTIARRIRTVVSQYWTAESAARNLEVLRQSEESSRNLLENTRKLIEADQVPAADLVQLEANLAFSESARIGGERQLFAARQGLGREIGLDAAEIGRLPLPSAPFPVLLPEEIPPPSAAGPFIDAALRRRDDLRAARERRTGAEIRRAAAENALKPQLDLLLTPGYSGLMPGSDAVSYFSPLYRNVPGASAAVGFSLSWPIWNHRAEGILIQVESLLRESALTMDLLAKGIGADVPTALDAVGRSARQLDRAREAVRLFERAVVNQEKKLKAGSSTLLDVISQRDRLTSARQAEVSSELSLALALLDLRFTTGTLLGDDTGAGSIQAARLTTLPALREEGPP